MDEPAYSFPPMARRAALRYDPRSMDELAQALEKLGGTMRRLALYLEFFALRVASLASDTRVIDPPRRIVPLKRRDFSNN